jgi:hypothetical protein
MHGHSHQVLLMGSGYYCAKSGGQMQQILKYAQHLAHANTKGGRVVQSGDCTGVMYDCPVWDDAYSEALTCRYPQCRISIRDAQDMSTSGFAIFFQLEQQPLSWLWRKPSYMVCFAWMCISICHIAHLAK